MPELLLDSLLIGGLYRRMRKAELDSLTVTTFKRTLGPALIAIVFLGFLGLAFEAYAPGADSIRDVFSKP